MKLSVGLPTFKANKICWLPMESLCNQIGIDFEWELIVCEEIYHENIRTGEICSQEFFEGYQDRLSNVGCVDIKYICPVVYIPLEVKWKLIVDAANKDSKALILQASDNYSAADRLAATHRLIEDGADWVNDPKTYFYNCKTHRIILRDATNHMQSRGVNIGIRMELLKDLPFRDRGCSVDSWLYEIVKQRKDNLKEVFSDGQWETGICTDGFNRLSFKRAQQYVCSQPPFYKTNKTIKEIVPGYVADKLLGLDKYAFGKKGI